MYEESELTQEQSILTLDPLMTGTTSYLGQMLSGTKEALLFDHLEHFVPCRRLMAIHGWQPSFLTSIARL